MCETSFGIRNVKLIAFSIIVVIIASGFTIYEYEYFSVQNEMRFSFNTEWYDPMAAFVKKLQLTYCPSDNSIELFDTQAKKLFLKRIHIRDLEERDFYLGNIVVVLSRQLKLISYADDFTKMEISRRQQRTFAMVKPDAVHRLGEIVQLIYSKGFEITQMKMVYLTREQAQSFYVEHREKPFFESIIHYITSGPVVALELMGNEAVQYWRKVLGPTDSDAARVDVPDSLRAKFGTDEQLNAAHGSDSYASANRELDFFFGHDIKATALFKNNTCCIIKPHAVSEGNMGAILTSIAQEGFQITALQLFRINREQAEEFLEVYKDVLTEYPRMVHELISGPMIALEITSINSEDEKIPQSFREFVGPMDPEIARELRPHSLRARFGHDRIKNAVHCTDLPEDGPLEEQLLMHPGFVAFCSLLHYEKMLAFFLGLHTLLELLASFFFVAFATFILSHSSLEVSRKRA